MKFDELAIDAVIDAARTVQVLRLTGARAQDVATYLGCAPSWVPIEMEIRHRDLNLFLRPWAVTPKELIAWSRVRGWS